MTDLDRYVAAVLRRLRRMRPRPKRGIVLLRGLAVDVGWFEAWVAVRGDEVLVVPLTRSCWYCQVMRTCPN